MTENREQKDLGLRMAEHRRKLNMTQDELANRLGVTPQALSQYERGLRYPDIGLLKNLCKILQISADYLLGVETGDSFAGEEPVFPEEVWRTLRNALEPLKLIFGEEITPFFMQEDFLGFISAVRVQFAKEGILLPVVRIMDLTSLKPREFMITAYDNVLYHESIPAEQPISVKYIIGKLENVVRKHYDEIISPDIIKHMVDNLAVNHPALINHVVPEQISYIQLTSVCKAFVRRGNSLAYLPKIIEVLSDLQRDGIKRDDGELVDLLAKRIERKDNLWVYLGELCKPICSDLVIENKRET